MSLLLVGAGGILGALLRWQISRLVSERWAVSFPLATLLVNWTGAWLLGWFTRVLSHAFPNWGTASMLFLGTGFCGAYTTFSSFSYEFVILVRERRLAAALTYATLTCIGGFAAAGLGLFGFPS